MDALKRFSIAAMATVLVAGLTPALAQTRDTRPEPDRPRVENGGGGDSDIEKPTQAKLPRGADGTTCVAGSLDLEVGFYVELENETGKIIPKGTVITLYVQPGNIQKLMQLNFDWKPGVDLSYTFFGDYSDLTLPIDCSFKLSPGRGPAEPKFELPKEEPKRQVTPKYEIEPFVPPDLICHLWNGKPPSTAPDYLTLENPTDTVIPKGTVIQWTIKGGKTVSITLQSDWQPNSQLGFTSEGYGLDPNLPWDTVCSASIITP